ncbi:TNFAIP3-interacting protein 3-like isoform X1 [Poecilia latipinna]|uniref:TNFAIP3-interacting protein 3-like isoform X1 n=1 Tax=Poecilia latipinna TaxID=48699 RepID=UPI00072E6484|nr:PREDICTED: TNFAIP3-interacting protein 3-like isoform X1 [Poecilia latipinna]
MFRSLCDISSVWFCLVFVFLQFVHKNTGDSSPAETSEATQHKQTHRLYPTLPNINRFEVCLPLGSTGEKLCAAAESHNEQKHTQSEEPLSGYYAMKEQILILEQQNKELLAINNKWGKEYRTMVQYYKKKVQFLKALKQDGVSEEERSDEEERPVTFCKKEKVHKDTQPGKDGVGTELRTAEEETEELRAQIHTLTRRWQHQQEEIRRLNKALEENLQRSQPVENSSETLQDIWKYQAEVYKEDFLKERRDREKLKGKNLELEKRYKKVHDELRVFKSQVTLAQPVHRCSCTNRPKHPDREHQQQQQQRYTFSSKD